MDRNRPHYRTKAAWAAARAADARQRADALPRVDSGNWRGVRARMAAMAAYRNEARKFERLAERFRAQGV